LMAHRDAVGDGDGAEFSRRATGGGDSALDDLGLPHQRDVAGCRFVPAARHSYQRLVDLLGREPHRIEVRAMRCAIGTNGHVAAWKLTLVDGLDVHGGSRVSAFS